MQVLAIMSTDRKTLEWKEGLANDMHFIPSFDETSGYYDAAVEWW
jgi:hypothetical protein